MTNKQKLTELVKAEGLINIEALIKEKIAERKSTEEINKEINKAIGNAINNLLEEATYDSIAKGICTNPGCNYTTNVEPDQDTGHCENCGTKTVASCLVLAGLI